MFFQYKLRTALKKQQVLDAQLLSMLTAHGCSLTDSHTIDHAFACDKKYRSKFKLILEEIGLKVATESDGRMYLECTETASPQSMPFRTNLLVHLALKNNATYDGWATSLCDKPEA